MQDPIRPFNLEPIDRRFGPSLRMPDLSRHENGSTIIAATLKPRPLSERFIFNPRTHAVAIRIRPPTLAVHVLAGAEAGKPFPSLPGRGGGETGRWPADNGVSRACVDSRPIDTSPRLQRASRENRLLARKRAYRLTRSHMTITLRRLAGRILASAPAQFLLRPGMRDRGVIFMLHRFAQPDLGVPGHDPEDLRGFLEFIRKEGISVMEVGDLVRWARSPDAGPGPRIAFTLDDGYPDQAHAAATIFADFDVPVTVFPIIHFVDRKEWMWWDRLTWSMQQSTRPRIPTYEPRTGRERALDLSTPERKLAALQDLVLELRRVSSGRREAFLDDLAGALGVDIPSEPPEAYAPMSWDDARRIEAMGHTFGPHSMTHPVLSRESDERALHEIEESWTRLKAEVQNPVPVFCYPYGEEDDLGPREMRLIREAGLEAALTGRGGYVEAARGNRPSIGGPLDLFRLPRFGFPVDMASFVRIVSGLDSDGTVTLSPHRVPRKPRHPTVTLERPARSA